MVPQSAADHRKSSRMSTPCRIGRNCIIDDGIVLGDDIRIGNNVVLEGRIAIGEGTRIGHGCVIHGDVSIGRDSWLYPYCVLGMGPQHLAHEDTYEPELGSGRIIIGDHTTLREYSSVNRPLGPNPTRVGSGCYLMSNTHVAHDCVVRDHAILSAGTVLGGHTQVHEYANLGLGVNTHPYCRVGKYAMVGLGSPITKDVLPFALVRRQRFVKINSIGLERNHIPPEDIAGIDAYYRGGMRDGSDTWYKRETESFLKDASRMYFHPDFD